MFPVVLRTNEFTIFAIATVHTMLENTVYKLVLTLILPRKSVLSYNKSLQC